MTRLLWLAAQLPPPVTRDGARDAARRELSKRVYRVGEPGPVERFLRRVQEWIAETLGRLVHVVPGGMPALLLLLAIVVLVVVALRLGLGPLARDALTDRRPDARSRTADDYRAEAEQLAAGGRHKEALRARFRAVVRELEQRGVLDLQPGRTAGEIAREAGLAVPALRSPLQSGAELFDGVWYGDRPAGPEEYGRMRALDEQVRAERLVTVGAP